MHACAADAQACDPAKAGDDLAVTPGGYSVHRAWLRAAIEKARDADAPRRAQTMDAAGARLSQELTFLELKPAPDTLARTRVQAILNRREFRGVAAGPSWWDRAEARLGGWLDRLLRSAARASAARPWIGVAIEWMLLAGALAGLLAFGLRALRSDSLAVAMPWKQRSGSEAERDADWARLADAAAAQGAWREAVHALYWAAIATLTVNGRWQRAAPRTPREYLRLLDPASPQSGTLRTLTRLLEQVWYARREAAERDYLQARGLAATLGVPGDSAAQRSEGSR